MAIIGNFKASINVDTKDVKKQLKTISKTLKRLKKPARQASKLLEHLPHFLEQMSEFDIAMEKVKNIEIGISMNRKEKQNG